MKKKFFFSRIYQDTSFEDWKSGLNKSKETHSITLFDEEIGKRLWESQQVNKSIKYSHRNLGENVEKSQSAMILFIRKVKEESKDTRDDSLLFVF